MKRLFLSLLAFTLVFSAVAQNNTNDDKFTANMRKAMVLLDSSWVSFAKSQEAANLFERLADYKKDDWRPRYYQALCLINLSWGAEGDKRKLILETAQKALETAKGISPNNSELVTLEGYMYQSMIMINVMTNGQIYGPKATQALQTAMQLDPNNPRPHYLLGQNLMYTPPQWGGGKDAAMPHIQKAAELFDLFKPADEFAPDWGKEGNARLLKQ